MKIHFYKYHGAGNDFILVDNRDRQIALSIEQIAFLCHRRFGIGADGLMLLQSIDSADFEMVYFNADGNESTMCGNGGRCIAAFAHRLGITGDTMEFMAIDGKHRAMMLPGDIVALHMQDVNTIEFKEDHAILNTGSPHFVQWVDDAATIDVFAKGREIRNRSEFQPKGINVNFVNRTQDGINIRTYERGVEDETLACGTGVTAAAIASVGKQSGNFTISVKAMGGILSVSFDKKSDATAEHIILTGGATFVFEGTVEL
jgi:diaminopimelate epimerase